MDDPLVRWREEFPILSTTTYLVSHSLGAMPRGAAAQLSDYAATWSTRGVRAWAEGWWEMPVTAGRTIAEIIGAPPDSISMHPNVTTMMAILLSCFEDDTLRTNRSTIVSEGLNFPSTLYLLESWIAGRGARLVRVGSDDGITVETGRMVESITEDTFLVCVSHVLFRSAYIQDVRSIIRRAHDVGAIVVVDAFQSVGVVPVDVEEMQADVLVGGVLKWLCGGPGGGFMYVRPELLQRLRPRLTGWAAHPDPFSFDDGPIRYRQDAFRLLNGTPSIPALYASLEGPRIIRDAGVRAIREKSIRLTSLLVHEAQKRGWAIGSPLRSEQRGGTVTIDMPHAREVSRAMVERGILVDYRKGGGIRIAPHFYSTEKEVRDAIDVIEDILATRTWERYRGERGLVT